MSEKAGKTNTSTSKSSWLVPGRYPPQGTSEAADAIRARRGARGLTQLDGTLLHCAPIAKGWNSLLGAVRTGGALPADVRELMILRVAAINSANYEWVHHEPVGREAGLTTDQLYVIRDTLAPLPPPYGVLLPLQVAALVYADQCTRIVDVGRDVSTWLKTELGTWVAANHAAMTPENRSDLVEDLVVEAAAVVATYNMVSRFLVALDVAGAARDPVPWPLQRKEFFISFPDDNNPLYQLHTVTLTQDPAAPWIVFANSLMTDLTMWSLVVPYILRSAGTKYNIVLHSQRGHGLSTLPPNTNADANVNTHPTTIAHLAQDIHALLPRLGIQLPVHAVVGVSQGGAVALSFATQFAHAARAIVACDTGPRTAPGNKEAWAERIQLATGSSFFRDGGPSEAVDKAKEEYGNAVGMAKLAGATVPRWFPAPSPCYPDPTASTLTSYPAPSERAHLLPHRTAWISSMVAATPVSGFVAGAGALSDYDVCAQGLLSAPVGHVLLIAGELDGGGKLGEGLRRLRDEWNGVRAPLGRREVEYVGIEGAGHLPMVDRPEAFAEVLLSWLEGVAKGKESGGS